MHPKKLQGVRSLQKNDRNSNNNHHHHSSNKKKNNIDKNMCGEIERSGLEQGLRHDVLQGTLLSFGSSAQHLPAGLPRRGGGVTSYSPGVDGLGIGG